MMLISVTQSAAEVPNRSFESRDEGWGVTDTSGYGKGSRMCNGNLLLYKKA